MEKIIAFFVLVFGAALFLQAQNVGIGNTDPAYKLDLSGRMRLRGGANDNFTAGLWLGGVAADSATNKMFFGMESDSTAGFYSEQNFSGWFLVADGRNSRLGIGNRYPKFPLSFGDGAGDKISLFQEFDGNYYGMGIGNSVLQLITPSSTKDIVFGYGKSASFNENFRIKGNGNVGIRTDPDFPLSFQAIAGDKISLFKDGNGNFYGLGIGNSLMQLMTPHSTSDIVFGYGKSAVFIENMRIKGNGNVGIGVSDPVYPLDISNRMRIRGKPGFSAGIWLNNEANTAIPAFVGMQAENQVGFFGNGAGWSFLMNTQNGAMSFGGNTGQPGQVLTSNGTGSVPTWQGATGSKLFYVAQPGTPSITNFTNAEVDIPGTTANFTLNTSSRVKFDFRSDVNARICFACGNKKVYLRLRQNISGGTTEINAVIAIIPNDEIVSIVSGPVILDLAPGSYSYKLTLGGGFTGSTISAGGVLGFLSWEIYPN
jgi:hypothetical protein